MTSKETAAVATASTKKTIQATNLGVERVGVMVATQAVYGGTSACSGSDKQTLHTANGADGAGVGVPC